MTTTSELMATVSCRYRGGDLPGAEQACLQVLQAEPRHPQALHILGVICHQLGRQQEAIAYLRRAAAIDSANPDIYANLGAACAAAGRLDEAMAYCREALRRRPDHPGAHSNLGAALAVRGRFAEAIGHYQHVLQLNPGCAATHNNLGMALVEEGRLQEAEEQYGEAVRLKPDYAVAHSNRAGVLIEWVRLPEAITCCHDSLRCDPDCVPAYVHLAELAAQGFYQFTDEQIRHLESLAHGHDSGPGPDGGRRVATDEASQLHFILAALCDRQGDYDRAFAHYRRGNELKAQVFRQKNLAFDRERHRRFIDDIIAVFDRRFCERVRSFGLATEVPVFVVGMPRTGSSLVAQMLASHPQVVAAGERRELGEILTSRAPYPAHMSRLDQSAAHALAEEYLRRLARVSPEAARIVDKMPHNYLHLGSLGALFQNPRIIHCRRDVMDVCLSCYFQDFAWVNYATSLEDLGFYYRQYERLMRHWREVLPVPVYELEYEALVRDPEGVGRGLLAFCGLDWSDRCLAFHENRRPVRTASKLQVRRPLYASSIARWKRYESQLLPLQQALASASSGAAASTAAVIGAHGRRPIMLF